MLCVAMVCRVQVRTMKFLKDDPPYREALPFSQRSYPLPHRLRVFPLQCYAAQLLLQPEAMDQTMRDEK